MEILGSGKKNKLVSHVYSAQMGTNWGTTLNITTALLKSIHEIIVTAVLSGANSNTPTSTITISTSSNGVDYTVYTTFVIQKTASTSGINATIQKFVVNLTSKYIKVSMSPNYEGTTNGYACSLTVIE